MTGLGNEQYDAQWEIPFHMTQYKELEQLLEAKAKEGYMIEGFTPFFQSGYFSYLMSGTYHFCIDIYPKKITETLLKSDEFNEYLKTCKVCGWTPKTYYKNLVVFYSQGEHRPMELQTDRALAYELLRKTTLRAEGRQLFILLLFNIALFALFIPSEFKLIQRGIEIGTPFYPQLLYTAALLGADLFIFINRLKRHIDISKAPKEGTPLPKSGLYTVNQMFCILFPMAFSLSAIILFFTSRSFILAGTGVLLLLLFLVLCFPLRNRTMELIRRLPIAKNDGISAALFALFYTVSIFALLGLYQWLL